jgi:hypothetical protein
MRFYPTIRSIFIACTVSFIVASIAHGATSTDTPDIDSIEYKTMMVINAAIQSDPIQKLTFKVSKDCVDSVLNDIEFCNSVAVSDHYDVSPTLDQTCVNACAATKSAADGVCDATRKTCNTGCDAVKASYNGCTGTCDATRKTCKAGCFGIKSCENKCNNVSSDCKKGCEKTFPYNSCTNACGDASSNCKNDSQAAYNSCYSGCNLIKLTGGYDLKLTSLKGLGSIVVTDVSNMTVSPGSENLFTASLSLNVPSASVNVDYKVWQDPIPAVNGNIPIYIYNTTGTGSVSFVKECTGNASSREPGYYVQISDLHISLPKHVWDSAWIAYLKSLGIDTSHLESGIDALWGLFNDKANGELSAIVLKELNKILYGMKIMDSSC